MKKTIPAIILVIATLLLCSCGDADVVSDRGDALEFKDTVYTIDAQNVDLSFDDANKVGETGVVVMTTISKKYANETLDAMKGLYSETAEKYDESNNESYIILIITRGTGNKAKYGIEDVCTKQAATDIGVYVKTETSPDDAKDTYEYHFIEVKGIYFKQTMNLFLDGAKIK